MPMTMSEIAEYVRITLNDAAENSDADVAENMSRVLESLGVAAYLRSKAIRLRTAGKVDVALIEEFNSEQSLARAEGFCSL